MRTLALILAVPAALAYGQSNPPPESQAPVAAPAAAEQAAPQTASPELVGQLAKETGITPAQAEGAAGALFGVAKTKLSADDFAKVAAAVPDMDALLKKAPAADAKASALDLLAGKAGASGLGGAAAAAGSLSKLGIKPETMIKLAPVLVKAVESKGGAAVASLLAGALK
jgi:hypothetical protein